MTGIAEGVRVSLSTSGFKVTGLFHATNVVRDLVGVRELHERLFGVKTMTIPYAFGRYANFCLVADVPIDSTSPAHDVNSSRRLFWELVGDHWSPATLWIEDMQDCIYQLHELRGFSLTRYGDGSPIVGVPAGAGSEDVVRIAVAFTNADETGVQWGLYEADSDIVATESFRRIDPRTVDGWTPLPPSEDSVGQIVHSHHTIVVNDMRPTVDFLVQMLDATVFYEEENVAFGTKSTYVSLGTRASTFEIAVPISDGPAKLDQWRNGNTYHALNFKVRDLDRAVEHLRRIGVGIEIRAEGIITTDPKDCHGLRYGLTAELPPNDPRRPS
jgi:hypothetical protein